MKISKKQLAKWNKQNMDRSTGHSVNNQELACERTKQKLEQPEVLAVFKRIKNR